MVKPKQLPAIFALFILLFITCQNKYTQVSFYENSSQQKELFEFFSLEDITSYEYTSFYKNGQIKNKGTVRNFKREGNWQEWYEDGVFRGDFLYENNFLDMHNENRKLPEIILYSDKLQPNTEVVAKVINLYPEEYIFCAGGNFIPLRNNNYFDYLLIPSYEDTVIFSYFHPFLYDNVDTTFIKASDIKIPEENPQAHEKLIEYKNQYPDGEVITVKKEAKLIDLLKVPIDKSGASE